MTLWVGGDDGIRHEVVDPLIGTPTGILPLQVILAGDENGQRRLVFSRLVQPVLTATPFGFGRIDLAWTSSGLGVTYRLYRIGVANPIYVGTDLAKSDMGLEKNTLYEYRLDVVGTNGEVVYTATASATTLDLVDLALTATPAGWEAITLTWTDPAPGTGITYKLWRLGVGTPIYTGDLETFTDSQLMPSTEYTYRLVAVSNGVDIEPPNEATATTAARAAMTVTATSPGWDAMNLSWVDPNAGAGVTYRVKRGSSTLYLGPNKTASETGALVPSTTYTYTVEALRGTTVMGPVATKTGTTVAHADLGLTHSGLTHNYALLSWTDTDQRSIDKYSVYKDDATWLEDSTSPSDKAAGVGLAPSTGYSYTVRAYRGATEIPSRDTTTFTSPAQPTRQITWEGMRNSHATYNGSGGRRTDSDGVTYCYSGYYSSNHGDQKSSANFDIPANVRGCISVDQVWISAYCLHAFNSTREVHLSVNHYANGATGGSGSAATAVNLTGYKPGWLGGTEWVEVGGYSTQFRSINEEFRVGGAWGWTFNPGGSTGTQAYYGYIRNDVRIRIVYTVHG